MCIRDRPDGGEEGVGAFNGDMGVIVDVDVRGGSVTVRSEDRMLVYTAEHVRELEPAYAVTCLLYTSVQRAFQK